MQKNLLGWNHIRIIISLALFNFVFLGTEYLFDDRMACIVEAQEVVNAQNQVLGASVLGFLCFGLLSDTLSKSLKQPFLGIFSIVYGICMLVIAEYSSFATVFGAGILAFIILGMGGSAVCYYASHRTEMPADLAKTVGISYAVGIFIQFVNNNLVWGALAQAIVLFMGWILLVVLVLLISRLPEQKKEAVLAEQMESVKGAVLALVVTIALMTVIFSTLDNAVTLVHAAGDYNIGQWTRLILAVSGLTAGVLFDVKERKYMSLMMYLVTLLSTICVVIIQFGGSFVLGLFVFYLSAGFFVVYFMTSFMDLSYYTKKPKLWAGIGRAVNNMCAILTSALSVRLLANGSQMAIMIIALILFVLINISMLLYLFFSKKQEPEKRNDQESGAKLLSEENHFALFVHTYALTERESEVLKALLTSDDNVQNIAEELAISRAALYRHIANLNEKTNTKSRVGIIQFYYEWLPE